MEVLSLIKEAFGFILPFLDSVPWLRAILGCILVFFLPGFAWTLVFFRGGQINVLERVALSFGLSIALVTIGILGLNWLAGVGITGSNSLLIIIVLTVIPLVWYLVRRYAFRRNGNAG